MRRFRFSSRWVTVGLGCAAITVLTLGIIGIFLLLATSVSVSFESLNIVPYVLLTVSTVSAVVLGVLIWKKIKNARVRTIIPVLAALFAILILGSSSFLLVSGGDPRPHPDPEQLAAFFADCEKGIGRWRAGQVDYPGHLSMELGESIVYVAAVDIRDNPFLAAKVIPGETPRGEPVAVQCLLSARLLPVGNYLKVNSEDWIFREFTPTGILN